jgi:hypothetical protein
MLEKGLQGSHSLHQGLPQVWAQRTPDAKKNGGAGVVRGDMRSSRGCDKVSSRDDGT